MKLLVRSLFAAVAFAVAQHAFADDPASASNPAIEADEATPDSPGEGGTVRVGEGTVHPGEVALVHVLFRGEHFVSKLAVIGYDEQSFGVLIEPSGRKKPLPL